MPGEEFAGTIISTLDRHWSGMAPCILSLGLGQLDEIFLEEADYKLPEDVVASHVQLRFLLGV
jgi:hypothetical protein